MSDTVQDAELDEAIAAAELDEDEAAEVRRLVSEGGIATAAIEYVTEQREPPEEPIDFADLPPAEPVPVFVVDTKKVEKEIERHLERMAELLGPTAEEYEPCEECGAVGLRIAGPKMKAHEMYRACPTCDGYGKVLTGAKDPQFAAQACPDCAGRGFQTRQLAPPPAGNGVQPPPTGAAEFGTESWLGDPTITASPAPTGWS